MKIKKLLSIFLTICIVFGTVSFSVTNTSALGNLTCYQSVSGDYSMSNINMSFYSASKVQGNTVTYYVDSSAVSDLKDLGTLYKADFAMNGCILSSGIYTSNSSYSVSDSFCYNSQIFATENTILSNSATGTLIGPAPKQGETVSFTVNAWMNVQFKYSGYPFSSGCSMSFNLIFYGIDMSELNEDYKTFQYMKDTCWTSASFDTYKNLCEQAAVMITNNCSTQTEIDELHQNIIAARDALVHNGNITECEYCLSKKSGATDEPIAYTNVVYGLNPERQCMDLYLPSNMQGDVSLILYLHGGGWIYGDKSEHSGRARNDCIKYGVCGLSISYRYTSQDVNAFDIVDDMAAALQKAKDLAKNHGLNIKQMMTYGGSAGGHLSLFYSYYKRDTSPIKPVAAISKCGPTCLANTEYLNSNLGESTIRFELGSMCGTYFTASTMALCYNELMAVSPINYVDSNTVPTVICHGMKDETVPFSDAVALDAKLSDYGVPHHFLAYPNTNHAIEIGTDPLYCQEADRLYDQYVKTYLLNIHPEEVHDIETKVVPKTCTTDGYSMEYCKICGSYQVTDVEKAGHVAETDTGYPASCTTTGLTDGSHCSVCKQTITAQTEIAKLPHSLGDWETVTPATYENAGLKVQKCTSCKQVINSEEIAKLVQPVYELKENSKLTIDSENKLILNVSQGTISLDNYFDLTGCTLEYEETQAGFGTGTKVIVKSSLNETLDTFYIVISGDGTGDGYVDAFDVSMLSEYINDFEEPADLPSKNALDSVSDGFLDATDLAYIISIANFE